jgi:filamentous hemagglutinin
LGSRTGRKDGLTYRQSATFTGGSWPLADGHAVPWSRTDWHHHGRPQDHNDVHQHLFFFDNQHRQCFSENNGGNWFPYGQ